MITTGMPIINTSHLNTINPIDHVRLVNNAHRSLIPLCLGKQSGTAAEKPATPSIASIAFVLPLRRL